MLATDVEGVYSDWGGSEERLIERATPRELRAMDLPAGSMGSKVEAACDFTERTGRRATIGALRDLDALVAGACGTTVVAEGAVGT